MTILLLQLTIFLLQLTIFLHNKGISGFQFFKEFILSIHLIPHIRIRSSRLKPTDNVLHIIVALKLLIINLNYLFVVRNIRLVKQAKNLLQTIVYPTMQQRNLYNDAIMLQALNKRIRNTLLYFFAIISISMMVNIYNRFLYLTDTMPQKIDSYHRNSILLMLFLQHILLVVILQSKITAETQSLSWQPGLLKFNQHQVRLVVSIQNSSSKIDAKHGDRLTTSQIRIFISANLHIDNFLLQ